MFELIILLGCITIVGIISAVVGLIIVFNELEKIQNELKDELQSVQNII